MVSDERIKLMCKHNWDAQAVQLRQEAAVLPCSLGAVYCYWQGTSQNGGKHTEIHHKHQVIHISWLSVWKAFPVPQALFACTQLDPGILLSSRGLF